MIYDELIEELALTLLTKARYEGCISVIDGFSQCEEDKTRIEYPVDAVMRIMPVGSEIWPEECEPLLKKIILVGIAYGVILILLIRVLIFL